MNPIVVSGEGGHSKVVQDIIAAVNTCEIVAILDDKYGDAQKREGILYGPISAIPIIENTKFIIAIGNNQVHSEIVNGIDLPKGRFSTLIHLSAIFDRYVQALGNVDGIHFMPELEGTMSNRWLTTLAIDQQKLGIASIDIINALAEENIEARSVWKPLHLQPVFKGVKYYPHYENESVSENLFSNGICLPSGSNMTDEEQQRVVDIFLRTIKRQPNRTYHTAPVT